MIAIILNVIESVLSVLTVVMTTSLSLLILLQRRHRKNLELFLSAATFLAASVASALLFSMAMNAMKLDFNSDSDDDSTICRLQGYFLYVAISAKVSGYCLQAASRLVHVVYPQHAYLRTFKMHLSAVIFSWIFAFFVMCPYRFIRNFIVYLPSDNYCLIPFTNLPAMVYLIVSTFIIQFACISLIYFRLAVFVHHSTMPNTSREFAVAKRLCCTILTIGSAGIATAVIWGVYLGTGYLHPLSYRIQILSYSISILTTNIIVVIINRRLRKLVFINRRRVSPQC